MISEARPLVIEAAHTTIWAFFAAWVLAIRFETWLGKFDFMPMIVGIALSAVMLSAPRT
jgi:hypothetical protein